MKNNNIVSEPLFKPTPRMGGIYQAAYVVILALLFSQCVNTGTPPVTSCPEGFVCKCVPIAPPQDTAQPPTIIGDAASKFGSCSFAWTPTDKMGQFWFVNTFISADFFSTATGIFPQPIWKSRTDPDGGLDSWIKALNDKGCTPMLVVNQAPGWMLTSAALSNKSNQKLSKIEWDRLSKIAVETYDPHADFKAFIANGSNRLARSPSAELSPDHPPIQPIGASRTDPKSYATYARIFGELAKRYGSVKHPESSLWVNTTSRWTNDGPNQKLSGLGYKFGLVVWNEPDKWWRKGDGSGIYFEPEEYAAMFSACYDAVKAADDKTPVYAAGLTGFDRDYMTRFINALKAMGKPLPDALNLHHYSHKGNRLGIWPPQWWDSGACAPELDNDFDGVKWFVDYAKSLNRPLFVTEFGVDTRPPSWMYAAPFTGKTSEQLQAEWVCRTYLEYMRLGVDKMAVFNGNDEPGAINGGLYTNSGILYGEGEAGKIFTPKPTFTALAALSQSLKGLTLAGDESTPTTRILRFGGPENTSYAFWSPTSDGRTFQATVGGKAVQVTEAVQIHRLGAN